MIYFSFKPLYCIIHSAGYREYMTLPKLMISGASDEFFMCDDYDFFYDDLLGPKYIWYSSTLFFNCNQITIGIFRLLENTGHSVSRGPLADQVWDMLETFYLALIEVRNQNSYR
jgi:hypothetical protein